MRLEWNKADDRLRRVITVVAMTAALVGTATTARAMEAPIAVSVAPLFVGEEKVVEGVVTAIDMEVNVLTLQLGTPPNALAVYLLIGLLSRFPPNPEVYYAGKTVRVAGTIEKFRDSLEMTIRNPENIDVVDLDAALGADPKLREEQQAMRARVKSLEERIRQLEAGEPPPQTESTAD